VSIIPLDVQRRCERRWAAQFSRRTDSVAPREQRPEKQPQEIAGSDKEQKKNLPGTGGLSSADVKPAPR
jgi:hypothetical protein